MTPVYTCRGSLSSQYVSITEGWMVPPFYEAWAIRLNNDLRFCPGLGPVISATDICTMFKLTCKYCTIPVIS